MNNYPDDNEGTAIHWHGFPMRGEYSLSLNLGIQMLMYVGANNMDGVVGLTQRAFLPSETFTYRFKIQSDESGTFWYVLNQLDAINRQLTVIGIMLILIYSVRMGYLDLWWFTNQQTL